MSTTCTYLATLVRRGRWKRLDASDSDEFINCDDLRIKLRAGATVSEKVNRSWLEDARLADPEGHTFWLEILLSGQVVRRVLVLSVDYAWLPYPCDEKTLQIDRFEFELLEGLARSEGEAVREVFDDRCKWVGLTPPPLPRPPAIQNMW